MKASSRLVALSLLTVCVLALTGILRREAVAPAASQMEPEQNFIISERVINTEVSGVQVSFTPAQVEQPYITEISESSYFHIPHIAAGEVILLGKIAFEPGQRYYLSLTTDRGRAVYIGVADSPNVTSFRGHTWSPGAFVGGRGSRVSFTYRGNEFRYLYVGSWVTNLSNVSVSLTLP